MDEKLIAKMREFFGSVVDKWSTEQKVRIMCDWMTMMQKGGNLMMRHGGRYGLSSPAEAISFDSPKSFLASLDYDVPGKD